MSLFGGRNRYFIDQRLDVVIKNFFCFEISNLSNNHLLTFFPNLLLKNKGFFVTQVTTN